MSNGVPSWTSTTVTPHTDFDRQMGPVEGSLVGFRTSTGLEGTVFVPKSQASNIEGVRAMIQQRVQELYDLTQLSG